MNKILLGNHLKTPIFSALYIRQPLRLCKRKRTLETGIFKALTNVFDRSIKDFGTHGIGLLNQKL